MSEFYFPGTRFIFFYSRRFLFLNFLFLIFYSNLFSQNESNSLAIINATIIDGTGDQPMSNSTIVVTDGTIDCIGNCLVPEGYTIIDAAGKFIIPGLIDTHVHYSTGGWIDSFPIPGFVPDVSKDFPYEEVLEDLKNNFERFHKSYLCSGVTAVFDTGGYPWLFDIRDKAIKSSETPHYYTTGPLLSFEKRIFPNSLADDFLFNISEEENLKKGIDFLIKMETNGINFHNIHNAQSIEILQKRLDDVIKEFKGRNVRFMAFSKGVEEAKIAIRKGVGVLIYSIDEELVDQEFLDLAKENDIIYVPTLGVSEALVDAQNGHISIDMIKGNCIDEFTMKKIRSTSNYYDKNSDRPTGNVKPNIIPDPEAAGIRKENLIRIRNAGIKIGMGSSAGVPFLFHGPATHNEMIAMSEAGLTPMEVIVASTKNGALVVDNESIGTLEKGNIADLIILNSDPLETIENISDINSVLLGGKILKR